MTPTQEIILAAIGSTGLWQFLRFLVLNHKKKKFDMDQAVQDMQKELSILHGNQEEMKESLAKNERDSVRTQLMLLMSDYPDNTSEIMAVAQHYFDDIGGNWYMTSMFNQWLESRDIGKPDWFKGE